MRTRWSVDHDRLLHRVIVTVESDEPETVRLVEEAAARAGVRLVRDLAGDQQLRDRVRDAIRADVDPAKLPGLEATVERVMAAIEEAAAAAGGAR